jgi:hypothetical protein
MDSNGVLPLDNNPPDDIEDRIILGIPPERAKKLTHNRWCHMEIKSKDEKGQVVYTYPFVDDPRDQLLIAYLSEYKPFKQEFGKTGPAWDKVLEGLSNEKENEDNYVFKNGSLAMTTIKNRWEEYIKFVGKYQARVPLNTGGDNEQHHHLIVAIEKLVNIHKDHTETKEKEKTEKHNKKIKEMDGADNLRQTGLGNMKRNKKRNESDKSDVEEGSVSGGSSKKPRRKKSAYSLGSSTLAEQHHERILLREKNIEKSLELKMLIARNKELDLIEKKAKRELDMLLANENCEDKIERKQLKKKMLQAQTAMFMAMAEQFSGKKIRIESDSD